MQPIGFSKLKYPLCKLHWGPNTGVKRTSIDNIHSN